MAPDGTCRLLDAPSPDYAGIHDLAESHGDVLLSTTAGLARLVGDRIVPDPAWEGIGGPILSVPGGEVWMCLSGRIHCVARREGPMVRGDGIALPPGRIRDLAYHGGAILGAARGRLLRLCAEEGRWEKVADLGGARPRGLRTGDQGELWASTYGDGLFRLDANGTIGHWAQLDGLPDSFLGWLGPVDEDGHLWLNSNSGVLRVTVASLDAYDRGEVEAIESCRFIAPETNGPGGAELTRERSALPTLEGLAIFDRSAIAPPTRSPAVRLLEAFIDGVPEDRAGSPSGRATLRFDFSAPIYPTDEGARFQHRLIGLDDAWHEAGAERQARFPELPAGNYAFSVRTRVPTGSWSNTVRSKAITIAPYWHDRTPVRLLMTGALLGAVWGLIILRTRSLANQNRALQSEIDQRLMAALRSECQSRTRRGAVHALLDVEPGTEDPPRDVALAFFRIAQEAIRNAERHGQATDAWLSLRLGNGCIELDVQDNGVGFDADAPPIGGIGLKSMRERARSVGGDVVIDTAPGEGACVTVHAPAPPCGAALEEETSQ